MNLIDGVPTFFVRFDSSCDSGQGGQELAISRTVIKVENGSGLFVAKISGKHASVDCLVSRSFSDVDGSEYTDQDVRSYPKTHEHYDLAKLTAVPNIRYELSNKAIEKYDKENIALIDRSALDRRQVSYGKVAIVPDFIHDFFCLDSDTKSQAFAKYPQQFIGTAFHEQLGGFVTMPNKDYVPGKEDAYADPGTINESLKYGGGIALVSYWVPPIIYEGVARFDEIFSVLGNSKKECPKNISIESYKETTGIHHLTTTLDIRKEYLPLLVSLKLQVLSHLADVYGLKLDEGNDKIDFYFHSPIYGDRTAGLHLHTRVNQATHAGEFDTQRLGLDDLLSILKDDQVNNQQVKDEILNVTTQTASGKFFTMSPVWGADQFENQNIKFDLISNPWRRPL